MGFFGNLLGVGVAIGAGYAIARIADKVIKANPDGIKDYNQDGVVDYKDYATAVGNATKEVAQDASTCVKSRVEDIKENPDKYKEGAVNAYTAVKDGAVNAYTTVKDKVTGLKDKAYSSCDCECCADDFKDTVEDVADAVQDKAEEVADAVQDKAADAADAVKDAVN